MPVTLKDVAERSGFSIPSVSYALNGKGHLLRKETRDRIVAAAEELGYRANASARAVRRGRLGTVALILSTHRNLSNLPPGLLAGIHDELEARGERLLLSRLPDERLVQEDFAPKFLREAAADGLLIDYTHGIPRRLLQLLEKHKVPCIWLNSKQPADCVYPNDWQAGRQATEYLLGLGHRQILFMDLTMSGHYSSDDRHAGYVAAMQAAGLPAPAIREEVPAPERLDYCRRWLQQQAKAPTAVVTYGFSEVLAMKMLVGRELSAVTFGDRPFEYAGEVYTTWLTPDAEVGRVAVEMLMQKLKAPQKRMEPRTISFQVEYGNSCRQLG